MRHLPLLLVLTAGAVPWAGFAVAQPTVHLTWDSCAGSPLALTERSFEGPAMYRQVVSGTGFSGTVRGYEVVLRARAPGGLADAWRIDAAGCQAGMAAVATTAASKSCPSLGAHGSVTTSVSHDPVSGSIDVRVTSSFSAFSASPGTTYSLFRIDYDLTAATAGATSPGDSCGGANESVCFSIVEARWVDDSFTERAPGVGNGSITWNDAGGNVTACSDQALDGVRLDEMMTACASGDTAVAFVELVADRPATFAPELRLQVRSRAGELVLDQADLFGARSGQPWAQGTRWLLATPAFSEATGLAADLPLALPLDGTGGSIVLVDERPGAPLVHAFRYGGAGEPPAPAPGRSLERGSDGTFSETATPTPTNGAGATAASFACRSLAAGVRIQEFAIDCDGCVRQRKPFFELVATEPGQRFVSGLRLHVLDATGAILLDVGDLFDAAHVDQPWPEGTTWLLASTTSVPGPDRSIAGTLSPSGGTVRLVDIPAGRMIVSEVRYGSGGYPAPALGNSLERRTDGSYIENPSPTPTRHDGQFSAPPGCFLAPPVSATRFSEIGLACSGGDGRSQFLELTSMADQTLMSRIRLRIRDAGGAIVVDRGSLFSSRAEGTPWPAGRTWLFATQLFAEVTGLVPDLALPAPLAADGGSLVLYDPGACSPLTIDSVAYGVAGAVPPPAPGRSLVRAADGSLVETSQLSPRRFDGSAVTANPCPCPLTATRISEIGLACSGGDAKSQFLELTSTADQALPSRLRLRVRNASGTVVSDHGALFASRPEGTPWAAGGTWLLGTRAFSNLTGLEPDFLLSGELPAAGATITLYDPGLCGVTTIDEVTYGLPGSTPAPAPGRSLERSADGTLREISPIGPMRFDGEAVHENLCVCPVSSLSCDEVLQFAVAPRGKVNCLESEVGFDLVQGVMHAYGGWGRAVVADEYTVTGLPAGSEVHFAARLEARVSACGGFDDSGDGRCSARDGSNEVSLGVSAFGQGRCEFEEAVLRLELRKIAGEPFRLDFLVSGTSGSTGGDGSGYLRLTFVDLPPGARITSCHGYLQDGPTAARLSLVTHETAPGRVRLVWQTPDGADIEGTLERSTERDDWSMIANLRSGPGGMFEYEDNGVEAGGRFAYRLGVAQGSLRQWSEPVWVDVPSGLRLAIQGIAPNPSAGDAFISFSLPRSTPARIELLDIQGRKVADQDLGALEAGRHVVRLAGSVRHASGTYILRLLQAGEVVVSKLTRAR